MWNCFTDNFAPCSSEGTPYCTSTGPNGDPFTVNCTGVCKESSDDSRNGVSYCCAFTNGEPNPDGYKHCCYEEDACYDNSESIYQCPM